MKILLTIVILFIISVSIDSFGEIRRSFEYKNSQLIQCAIIGRATYDLAYVDCTKYKKGSNKNYGGQRGFISNTMKLRHLNFEVVLYDKTGKEKNRRWMQSFDENEEESLGITELSDLVTEAGKIHSYWTQNDHFTRVKEGDTAKIVGFLFNKNMEIFDRNGKKMKGTLGTPSPNLNKDAAECFYEVGFETFLIQNADNSNDRCHNTPVCSAQVRCIKNKKWINQHIFCSSYKKSSQFVCPTVTECFNNSKKIKQVENKKPIDDDICTYQRKVMKFKGLCNHRPICVGFVSCVDDQLIDFSHFSVACRANKNKRNVYRCPSPSKCIDDTTLVITAVPVQKLTEGAYQLNRRVDPDQTVDSDATQ